MQKTLNESLLNEWARLRVRRDHESRLAHMSQFAWDFISFSIENTRETGTIDHPAGRHLAPTPVHPSFFSSEH